MLLVFAQQFAGSDRFASGTDSGLPGVAPAVMIVLLVALFLMGRQQLANHNRKIEQGRAAAEKTGAEEEDQPVKPYVYDDVDFSIYGAAPAQEVPESDIPAHLIPFTIPKDPDLSATSDES